MRHRTKTDSPLTSSAGFTLIEILVVVTVIAFLASITLVGLGPARGAARDAERKATLRGLQSPIQLYFNVNGNYPSTGSSWYSSEPGDNFANSGGDWIPGLAPRFISEFPRDPKGGPGNKALSLPSCPTSYKSAYLYKSNGAEYKILSHCAPEGAPLSSADRFYDPARPGWAWMVCEGATGCTW